ncbi:MAG: hypothetical protein ACTSYA_06670 [Candidatus Kariarchaeaceae archaeon]
MSKPSTSSRSRRMQLAVGLMFILGIMPILMAISPFGVSYGRFSPYNSDYDGLSVVYNELSNSFHTSGAYSGAPKYAINTSISSMNILNRLNASGVTIIMGPASSFDFSETLSMLFYLFGGGSLIIVDDFGTGNEILDPIFNMMENWDTITSDMGMDVPSIGSLFTGGEDESGEGEGEGESSDDSTEASLIGMLGSVLKRFGFNSSAILMDAGSNDGNPVRPLITDIDHSGTMGVTFTEGVNKVQLEYASCISLKVNHSYVNSEGDTEYRSDWQPLTKINAGDLGDLADYDFEFSFSLFPLYSTTSSWLETDFKSAQDGTAEPDVENEWGGAAFAPVLTIPLFEGAGKMIFVSDPSIFINRWTQKTDENDNLKFVTNLIDYATNHQNETTKMVLFDLGHSYQPLNSPTLYSMAVLKLLANVSMFPLLAPFAPWFMSAIASKLVPKKRRLKPMLLTKRRAERGYSFFDQKLKDIKYNRKYYEALSLIFRRLKRSFNSSELVKEYGDAKPASLAKFFAYTHSGRFNERTVRNRLSQIEKFISSPKDRGKLTEVLFRSHANYLKELHNLFISE